MSYPRLVGYAHHPQAESEKFFDQIIFFVIERGAAQMTDRGRVIDGRAVLFVNEGSLARLPDAVRHHVHRAIQRNVGPFFRTRGAIFHFRFAPIVREQLIRCRAFRTKIPLADGRLRVAFDRNQFAVFVINQLPATNAAVWANRSRDLRVVDPRVHCARFVRHRFETGAVFALADLPNERPFRKQREHNL